MADEMTITGKNILLRAKITDEEWNAIRKGAIDHNMYVSDFNALLLREGLKVVAGRKESAA